MHTLILCLFTTYLNHIEVIQLCHSLYRASAVLAAVAVVVVVVVVHYVVVHVYLLVVNERHLASTDCKIELFKSKGDGE